MMVPEASPRENRPLVDFIGGDDQCAADRRDCYDVLTDSEDEDQSATSSFSGTSGTNYPIKGVGLVNGLRQVVTVFFIYFAVYVPLIVYTSTRNSEVQTFESEFDALSSKVVASFGLKLANVMSAVDSLSISATSHAHNTKATWPFVTLLDFDLQGASAAALADGVYVGINHLIEPGQREAWKNYTLQESGWLRAALARQETFLGSRPARNLEERTTSDERDLEEGFPPTPDFSNGFSSDIFRFQEGSDAGVVIDDSPGPYFPAWQVYPVDPIYVNYNWLSLRSDSDALQAMLESKQAVMSEIRNVTEHGEQISAFLSDFYSGLMQTKLRDPNATYNGEPVNVLYYPVFDTFHPDRKIVGSVHTVIVWNTFFYGILPPNAQAIVCVVENACGGTFTMEVNGEGAMYLGTGDLHDSMGDGDIDDIRKSFSFSELGNSEKFTFSDAVSPLHPEFCPFTLYVYPSDELRQETITSAPAWYTLGVAITSLLVSLISCTYDYVFQRRVRRILKASKENRAIVSSIFPAGIRNRLSQEPKEHHEVDNLAHPKSKLRILLDRKETPGMMDESGNELDFLTAKPIADLFPFCTVIFADISGFSAWSSEREPEQVFTLLETIFQAFDKLARRRSVFKVETIGDSYVAVTGLPNPQPDHAVRMARFARDCMSRVNELTRMLETTLGPDTGELRMRFGLHSGQVTAGVLRGQKSRFQLFGDTVNTAARMESTGARNRIHISETTAALLINAGKERWVTLREDVVHVKGKGIFQTYWLTNNKSNLSSTISSNVSASGSVTSSSENGTDHVDGGFDQEHDLWGDDDGVFALPPNSRNAKNSRLIDWLVGVISIDLKRLVSQRNQPAGTRRVPNPAEAIQKGEMVLDEVVEAFTMPKFDNNQEALKNRADIDSIELSPAVLEQLQDFVSSMAKQYRSNPFHNFEHASHVTMSSLKLLKRIISPEDVNYKRDSIHAIASDIHKYTFGITSDALAHFAVTFAALIHDVDHRGVPNAQLAKEEPEMGARYKEESVAEQNSVDIAWDRLMDPAYRELQACIFTNEKELKRFRQYVVNLVMATDIFNRRMKELRNLRWDKAFSALDIGLLEDDTSSLVSSSKDGPKASDEVGTNLKATIVLEHIIQAADVSHTMQHWVVYKKWNERLFQEMYSAYDSGRAEKDPSEGWYKGELWFYDNYSIPLAQKLEDCGVFGVSSDECLNYALENRKEWALKGKQLVTEMKDRYQKRKMLEVGGFSPDEIDSFSPHDLEYILLGLIKKGRSFGAHQGLNKDAHKNAARAWLDALEIYDKAPAASHLSDKSIIFPVFSGLMVYLKGGLIQQDDKDKSFELDLSRTFVRQANKQGNPVHYSRALAAYADVLARQGRYEEALGTFDIIMGIYDPGKHSEEVCTVYGTDRTAQIYSQRAMWYLQLGRTERAVKACDHVVNTLLPMMDPKNILNTFELLLPVIRIQRSLGEASAMGKLLDEHVVQNFHKYNVKSTPCRPILKPLSMLLQMLGEKSNGSSMGISEKVEWLLVEENGEMSDFLDNSYSRLGWSPNSMTAELCLLVADRLQIEGGDEESIRKLVHKGMKAAVSADQIMKNEEGNVFLPAAYEIHEPVVTELRLLAEGLGISWEDTPKQTSDKEVAGESLRTSLGVVRLKL